MIEEYADPPGVDLLFEVAFQPSEDFVHKGSRDQPEIRTLLGRRNRILVGVPQTRDVLQHWPANASLDDEIVASQQDWDFFRIRLACSFIPDRGCRFVWVRLNAELSTDETSGPKATPIVFDLFPRDVTRERKFNRSFSITPALKFAFAELSGQASTETEGISYAPEMDAAGLLTATPAWTFRSSERSGLVGSRELFMLLKAPKGRTVRGRFSVGAAVHSRFGPVPLKRYGRDDLPGSDYMLAP